MKRLLLILACLMLPGPAMAEGVKDDILQRYWYVPPQWLANMRTIGVISLLGDTMVVDHVNVRLLFGDSSQVTVPVPDWSLDDAVDEEAASEFRGRYTIKKIQPANIADFENADGRLFNSIEGQLGDLVQALPPAGVEAYLIVKPVDLERPNSLSQKTVHGFGVYRTDFPTDTGQHEGYATQYEFLTAHAWLFDARTGIMLARSGPCLPQEPNPCESWWVSADTRVWNDDPGQLTAAQRAALKADFTRQTRDTVHRLLDGMGFFPDSRVRYDASDAH